MNKLDNCIKSVGFAFIFVKMVLSVILGVSSILAYYLMDPRDAFKMRDRQFSVPEGLKLVWMRR